MGLNDYRDEAGRFLQGINAFDQPLEGMLGMLQEELDILKAANPSDVNTISHQAYDLLFLLMEIAAQYHADLDAQWEVGQKRKAEKYPK